MKSKIIGADIYLPNGSTINYTLNHNADFIMPAAELGYPSLTIVHGTTRTDYEGCPFTLLSEEVTPDEDEELETEEHKRRLAEDFIRMLLADDDDDDDEEEEA